MILFSKTRVFIVCSVCTATLLLTAEARAVMDPRFELDPEALTGLTAVKKTVKVGTRKSVRTKSKKTLSPISKDGVYTVKRGDHLFKILMRDYGLSNNEAELFIEEIKQENNIYDIKRLKVGQKLHIPLVRRRSDGSFKYPLAAGSSSSAHSDSDYVPEQGFTLDSPLSPFSPQEAVSRVQGVWNQIVPATKEQHKPLSLQTENFSLTLDPERYPMFARMDGGRIVLDQKGSIPPLVKSLIEDKDSTVRILTEPPTGNKYFIKSLLEAAGFYSVEENFSLEFGVDPKITLQADFKVEKTADSLLKQDVVLVNSSAISLPPTLSQFLKKEGFSLYEPFASLKPFAIRDSRKIHFISAKKQPEMIDDILAALSVTPERDRRVDVFSSDNNGISLSVKAERYFERGGKRYVVTNFDGDPINYTLFRILETKGFNVVILEAKDDFRKISEKLASRMKIKGIFAQHKLLQDEASGYSLQMSGFMLQDNELPGGGIFLTDRAMDRIVTDLVTENGFTINNR